MRKYAKSFALFATLLIFHFSQALRNHSGGKAAGSNVSIMSSPATRLPRLPYEKDRPARRSTLTLLVNFWLPDEPLPRHHRECESALVLNSVSNIFHTVVVLLQSKHSDGCTIFLSRMNEIRGKISIPFTALLRCVNYSWQPSYFDMFQFSIQELRKGIVVLANTDMVFDSSILSLRNLGWNELNVIATSGFSKNSPIYLQSRYVNLTTYVVRDVVNRCYNETIQQRTSWDAFVFRSQSLRLTSKQFQDRKSGRQYLMNQNGAEAAALAAIVASNRHVNVCQVCDSVKMWHFHTQEKTHSYQDQFVDAHYQFPRSTRGAAMLYQPVSWY